MASSAPSLIKSGELEKRGDFAFFWTRYFRLWSSCSLEYWKSESNVDESPRRRLDIVSILKMTNVDDRELHIELASEIWKLRAKTELERDSWYKEIQTMKQTKKRDNEIKLVQQKYSEQKNILNHNLCDIQNYKNRKNNDVQDLDRRIYEVKMEIANLEQERDRARNDYEVACQQCDSLHQQIADLEIEENEEVESIMSQNIQSHSQYNPNPAQVIVNNQQEAQEPGQASPKPLDSGILNRVALYPPFNPDASNGYKQLAPSAPSIRSNQEDQKVNNEDGQSSSNNLVQSQYSSINEKGAEIEPNNSWSCPKCTFANDKEAEVCMVCLQGTKTMLQ